MFSMGHGVHIIDFDFYNEIFDAENAGIARLVTENKQFSRINK